MTTTLHLTVADNGMTMRTTITQKELGQLQQSDLVNCSAKFSLLRTGGSPVVNEAAATIGTFTPATNSIDLSYRLQSVDVASAISDGYLRWVFILPDGGKIHAPGNPADRTLVQIHA